MWYMIDYENMHEEGLYGIEILRKDNRIFVFYNMGDKENIENGELREVAERSAPFQDATLYKRRKSALDFYISSKIGEIYEQGVHQDITVIGEGKGFQALCEYWMYVVDIRKRIILRDTIHHALFDFEFDRLGCHGSCSDSEAIYPHCVRQYDRKMGCELYWHLKKYMGVQRNYVNVTSM